MSAFKTVSAIDSACKREQEETGVSFDDISLRQSDVRWENAVQKRVATFFRILE